MGEQATDLFEIEKKLNDLFVQTNELALNERYVTEIRIGAAQAAALLAIALSEVGETIRRRQLCVDP